MPGNANPNPNGSQNANQNAGFEPPVYPLYGVIILDPVEIDDPATLE